MLLPQTKEREYRFRLALRMGLPIFALIFALVIHTFIENSQTLQTSFYVESLILLVFSIYFFLYLIYNGFEVRITDEVSKTFTREYLFSYLKNELKKNENYALMLISIDNLNDINTLYGIKNGDRVLEETAKWIAAYFKAQKIENFPLGHIKGGDFIIGLEGSESEYTTLLELMCLKSDEMSVDDIEIKLSGAITDTSYSHELDYMVENLFELQEQRRNSREALPEEPMTPNELESSVINAINKRKMSIMAQDVYEDGVVAFKECFVKLRSPTDKPIYPKTYTKIINRLGLTVEYDLMVLETLLLSTSNNEDIYALNISPTSLRNEKFLQKTKELLRETKKKLMFVLEEAEYFSHTSKYNSILHSLKNSGVLIAISRLGSIHSSFLYLRELDIDIVRFDTYYSKLEKLKENRSVVEGFHVMAKEKGVKTWIKNLENEESVSLAQELQVSYTQGKMLSGLEEV